MACIFKMIDMTLVFIFNYNDIVISLMINIMMSIKYLDWIEIHMLHFSFIYLHTQSVWGNAQNNIHGY